MANITLLDIAKMNNTDDVVGLIEESIKASPEARGGTARTISGTSYKTLHRTDVATVGFRKANEGAATVKSKYDQKLVETFILDASYEMDRAVADAHEDGRETVLALEASGIMEGAFRALSSQFYYGTGSTYASSTATNAADGFVGLQDVVPSGQIVDAGGTSAATAASVWAVRWGVRDVTWVFGRNGTLDIGDIDIVRIEDSNSNPYTAYRQELLAYVGLQVVNPNSIAQIKNLTADSGKGLTDDLMFQLLEQFPTGIVPDVFFLTKRSLRQLRESRTATNSTGAPAPIPTEVAGIPILLTDGLVETETIT